MDLYVFGAGASAAEGAPATRDLLCRAWQLLGPPFHEKVTAVWRFLEEVFGVPVTGPEAFAHLPAVDEVVSLVDWSLHVNQGLGHRYDPPRLYHVRRALEHLICAALDAAVDRERCRTGPHARFVRARLAAPGAARCAFISLNYDTLLDRAMAEAGIVPDYGLGAAPGPAGAGAGMAPGPARPGAPAASGFRPLLAKLHGSLNWARCTACGQVAAGEAELGRGPAVAQGVERRGAQAAGPGGEPGGPRCAWCGNDRLHGLIIPPTWLKSYDGSAALQQVWDRALHAVQQAERIIFVGYSMPPADLPIYHLIRRGLLVRRLPGRPRVLVINHAREGASAEERRLGQEAVMDRFTRLFGPEVAFDFTGFHGQTGENPLTVPGDNA